MYHIDYFVIALENLYLTVTGILAVGIALLIIGIIICVCCCWRRRKKTIKLNKRKEQSPQDTHPAPLTSAITLPDNNSLNEVRNFNSSTNNISQLFHVLILMSVVH